MKLLTLCMLLLFGWFETTIQAETPVSRRPITIRAIEGLQFDPPRVKAEPGHKVLIRFINRDPSDQPHNLLILKPGSLADVQAASMKITSESEKRGYVPEHDAILAASKLLIADQSDEFYFTAPEEDGVYPFVCTYPGHAMVMYGAIYVGEKWGDLEKDPNVSQLAKDRLKRLSETGSEITRPFVKRLFIEEAGPAAIAVALDSDINYCWDAGNCRLRFAWKGEFLKARDNSRSNGNYQNVVAGEKFWDGNGDENTFAIKVDQSSANPEFKGYRLVAGIPEFRYLVDGLEVTEFLKATPVGLISQIKVKNAKKPIHFYAPGAVTSSKGTRQGDYITIAPKDATDFQLSYPAN